jgi:UPF0716 protein FxsA
MLALLAALFIVVSLVEIYLFVLVGQAIGALNTIGLVILISFTGAWLAKREGLGVLARLRAQLEAGNMPGNELIDGVLILVGGVMLVVPGFITDFCGLLLLFPPSRSLARNFAKKRLRLRIYGIDVIAPIRRVGDFRRNRPAQPYDRPYDQYEEYDRYDGPQDVIDL